MPVGPDIFQEVMSHFQELASGNTMKQLQLAAEIFICTGFPIGAVFALLYGLLNYHAQKDIHGPTHLN